MATVMAKGLVQGAARIPLPFGLFSVMGWQEGSTDRWEAGVEWEAASCDPAGGIGAFSCDPDTGEPNTPGLPKEFGNSPLPGEASQFTIYGNFECNPLGWNDTARDFAIAHLTSREEARVEEALWTGDLGNVPNFAGANGYPDPDDLGTFSDAARALGAVEDFIATSYGSLGVIHMSRATATDLIAQSLLVVSGGRLTTVLRTPVVAGAGYPDGAIVGTPALFGYRSEIFTPSPERAENLFDAASNVLYAVAERSYLIGFDPCGVGIAHIAASGETTP